MPLLNKYDLSESRYLAMFGHFFVMSASETNTTMRPACMLKLKRKAYAFRTKSVVVNPEV